MTDGSPTAPVPPATSPTPSASRLRRERPEPSRRKPWVWLLGLALFATVTIVFFGRKPERVTHAEALEIAARFERSKTLAEFRAMLDVQVPAGPETPTGVTSIDVSDLIAEQLASLANQASLAFVRVDLDERSRRTLLFRFHRRVQMHDYVRVLLERRNDEPRVTNYYQLSWGGWLEKCLTMDESTVPAMRAAMARSVGPDGLDAWPATARRSAAFASAQLLWLVDNDLKTFPAALERFRADFPRNPAADFVIATRWLTLALRPEDAITALDRIQEDHYDQDFLSQLREKVWK